MTEIHEPTLGYLLHDTTRLMRRRFDRIAGTSGLTRAQWQVLAVLWRDEGINQTAIADRLDLEPISVCRLVDRMETAGWVERRQDPTDRRARLVFMTEAARPAFTEMKALGSGIFDEMMAGFTEEERDQLMTLLKRCHANLTERNRGDADDGADAPVEASARGTAAKEAAG
ncbi:Salmolysin [Hartmannibacter diazotrophicus]|uniref:Salmolysin n=1 Tax=Hartmannibacter diazotrophicus TaxID=1482074 RepID=A0A2C9D9V9_9HYPH|nr:MarR family transcriptional regulator [Hartmannibacter diazotrophicus]SON57102.1 Salmolysin [Hartmannibacter diazotrophicus]